MKNAPFLRRMLWFVGTAGWLMPARVVGQEPTMAPTINGTFSPVAPTPSPSLPPIALPSEGECFTNTTLLFEAMLRGNSFVDETYIVCPNTRLKVGFFRSDTSCCDDGVAPLILRSRTTVKCGDSGSSDNNCTLYGGNAHLFRVSSFFGEDLAQNMRVEGFTFESTEFISTAMAQQGDITFNDCRWMNNQVSGVVFGAYSPSPESERRMLERAGIDTEDPWAVLAHMMTREFLEEWVNSAMEDAMAMQTALALPEANPGHGNVNHDRDLQAARTMEITFENCLFHGNRQGPIPESGVPIEGVIALLTSRNPTNVINCTFEENVFDGSDGRQNGYAILSLGSPLEIRDICLIDNSFIGYGPIQAFSGAPLTTEGTYTTEDDLVFCEFAAQAATPLPESLSAVNCSRYDRLSCRGPPRPTSEPTSAPNSSGAVSIRSSGKLLSLLIVGLGIGLMNLRM